MRPTLIKPANGLRFSGAAPIDGNTIVAETGAEKGTISLDAKWRPLQQTITAGRDSPPEKPFCLSHSSTAIIA